MALLNFWVLPATIPLSEMKILKMVLTVAKEFPGFQGVTVLCVYDLYYVDQNADKIQPDSF